MQYLSLFDDFNKIEESYNFDQESLIEAKINQMLSLKQNGCVPGFSIEEFKKIFSSNKLLENRGYDQSEMLLEKAYNVYELGMLSEAKKHWFDTDKEEMFEHGKGAIPYLEFDGKIILFKDMEGFMISEGALKMIKNKDESINENVFSELLEGIIYDGLVNLEYEKRGGIINENWLTDIGNYIVDNPVTNAIVSGVKGAATWTYDNVIKPTGKFINDYVVEPLGKFVDFLTDGAKALYDFSAKIINTIKEFLKEFSDIIFIVTLVLQVIGGVISFFPGIGTTVGPILLIIAGAIQIAVGALDVEEGISVCKNCPVDPSEKAGPIILEGSIKILGGGVSTLLGVHDIITSPKAAVPGGAFSSTAAATTAKAWVKSTGKKLSTGGTVIALFEGLLKWIIEHAGEAATKAITKKAVGYGAKKGAVLAGKALTKASAEVLGKTVGGYANQCVIPMICMGGKYALGWLWDTILGAESGIGKMLNSMMDIPKNIVDGIETFDREYGSSIMGYIIAGALNMFVKPAADFMAKFVDSKIRPVVKPVTNWMISLGKQSKAAIKMIEGNPKLNSAVGGKGVAPPPKGSPPVKKVVISSSDKQNLSKIAASKYTRQGNKEIAKEGGWYNELFKKQQAELLAKVKKQQEKLYKEKYPGIIKNKSEGEFITLKDGTLCFKYKSKAAHGSVILYNNGRYQVKDGPNEGIKGDYTAKKNIDIKAPKGGFKKPSKKDKSKNESRNYVRTFEGFSFT